MKPIEPYIAPDYPVKKKHRDHLEQYRQLDKAICDYYDHLTEPPERLRLSREQAKELLIWQCNRIIHSI